MNDTDILAKIIRPALSKASQTMPGIGLESASDGLVLYGAANAVLDSMNLVSFVFILEDALRSAAGVEVKITADDLLGRATNPFVSLRELASFLSAKIEGASGKR